MAKAGPSRWLFDDEVRRLRPELLRHARRNLKPGLAHIAEEAVNDALMDLYSAHEEIQSVEAWLRCAVSKNVIDRLRKESRREALLVRIAEFAKDQTSCDVADLVEYRMSRMGRFRDLPPKWQAALRLLAWEVETYEEGAAAMGVPPGTFAAWVHRARKRLEGGQEEA